MKSIITIEKFISGLYSGVREKPVTTTATYALGFVTGGIGAIGSKSALSIGFTAKELTTASKVLSRGMITAYGGTTAIRVLSTGDLYSGAETLGEITSTEILPFTAGAKTAGYGIRRYEGFSELNKQINALDINSKVEFKRLFAEAKQLKGIQPAVKDLSLKGMERIPQEAEDTILQFIQNNRRSIIVGGSVAQRAQLYVPESKPPNDIDIYVKGLFQESKAIKLAKALEIELTKAGIERVSRPKPSEVTIGGKKAIEFHTYKGFLRHNLEQVLPFYRTARAGLTKTPSDVTIQTLSTQLQRKLIGAYLDVGRSEDFPAFLKIKESLLETKKIQEGQNAPQLFSAGIIEKDLNRLMNFDLRGGEQMGIKNKEASAMQRTTPINTDAKITEYSSYISKKRIESYFKNLNKTYNYPTKNTGGFNVPYVSYPSRNITALFTPTPTPYIPRTQSRTGGYIPQKPSYNKYPPKTNITKIFLPPTITEEIKKKKEPVNYYYLFFGGRKNSDKQLMRLAYSVFLKRKGKYLPIASGLPRGKALQFGSDKAMRSLARSFKIKEMGTTAEQDIPYMPREDIFRSYQVKKGRKVPLQNTFIQFGRTSLSSPEEREAIKLSRKLAGYLPRRRRRR